MPKGRTKLPKGTVVKLTKVTHDEEGNEYKVKTYLAQFEGEQNESRSLQDANKWILEQRAQWRKMQAENKRRLLIRKKLSSILKSIHGIQEIGADILSDSFMGEISSCDKNLDDAVCMISDDGSEISK